MAEESAIEKIEDTVKKVPKKYWIIGGVVLILLILFLRKRAINNSQQSDSSGQDAGLSAAMQLPTGVMYSTIGGGGSSGTGFNSDITGALNSIGASTGATSGTTSQTVSASVSSPVQSPSGGSFTIPQGIYQGQGKGTSVINSSGYEASFSDIADFFNLHPNNGTAAQQQESISAASAMGFDEVAYFRAAAVNNVQQSKSLYVNGDTLGTPKTSVSTNPPIQPVAVQTTSTIAMNTVAAPVTVQTPVTAPDATYTPNFWGG